MAAEAKPAVRESASAKLLKLATFRRLVGRTLVTVACDQPRSKIVLPAPTTQRDVLSDQSTCNQPRPTDLSRRCDADGECKRSRASYTSPSGARLAVR